MDRLGYEYKSITIDGRKGVLAYLKVHYPNVPIQYCMFHQKQTIRQCLTNNPKTPCGQELKDIANHLKDYDTDSLLVRLNELKQQYRDFLKNRKAAEYKEKLFERANENSIFFGNCVVTLADINDLFEEVFGNDEE